MIDLKTRAVAPFPPDARTFYNIYKLQKHVLLRHQSYLIVLMGNKNLRFLGDNAPLSNEHFVFENMSPNSMEKQYLDLKNAKLKLYDPPVSK